MVGRIIGETRHNRVDDLLSFSKVLELLLRVARDCVSILSPNDSVFHRES
jgi:hypothetical protein